MIKLHEVCLWLPPKADCRIFPVTLKGSPSFRDEDQIDHAAIHCSVAAILGAWLQEALIEKIFN